MCTNSRTVKEREEEVGLAQGPNSHCLPSKYCLPLAFQGVYSLHGHVYVRYIAFLKFNLPTDFYL